MSSRIETQFGTVKDLDPTYTICGSAVASGHAYNMHLHVTNTTAATVKFRAFIADTSWSSGVPTGSTKVAAIAFDVAVSANDVLQITGIIMAATQKLVIWSETTDALDVVASGVDITL